MAWQVTGVEERLHSARVGHQEELKAQAARMQRQWVQQYGVPLTPQQLQHQQQQLAVEMKQQQATLVPLQKQLTRLHKEVQALALDTVLRITAEEPTPTHVAAGAAAAATATIAQ